MTHKEKVLAVLSDHEAHTHHELYRLGCIAHSRVADLRRDGHDILSWRDGDDYLYRLVSLEPGSSIPSHSFGETDDVPRSRRGGDPDSSEAAIAASAAASLPPADEASLTSVHPDQLELGVAA